jgi:hypothetical protein
MKHILTDRGKVLFAAFPIALALLLSPGCGGKYDEPLEVFKEPQIGTYNYGKDLAGFELATDMVVLCGHLFVSFETEGKVRDHFANGREYPDRVFEGVVRPTEIGEGPRNIAVVDVLDSLTVRTYSPGGGSPLLSFKDPEWIQIGGLAVDDDGNTYVSDVARNFVRSYNSRGIRRFETDLADSGFGIGHVMSPHGLCFDGEALLIAEADPEKAQVQRVRIDKPQHGIPFSESVPYISSFTDEDGNEIALKRPVAVATDRYGYIYVLDEELGKIFRYTADGISSTLVNAPTILGPDSLLAATAIGTFGRKVFTLETGTGIIHFWESTEQ